MQGKGPYPRRLSRKLAESVSEKSITIVTGMRRSGKTTLLKMVFDGIAGTNKVFFDLENPLEQKIFEETDFNNIWGNLKEFGVEKIERAYVFLDEMQAMPAVVKPVKYLYDHYDVKFFLTGSSSFYLKNLFPESLAGRKKVLELRPLDFQEFLVFKEYGKKFREEFREKDGRKNKIEYEGIKQFYDEYVEFGGFPQVVLEENRGKKREWLEDIFKSYFEKDVRTLADFREINAFRDLLLLLLKRVGERVEVSKLSSEVGVSRETVYSYLSFLEKTYFIDLLTPFTRSVDREVSGSKKVYACDTGMANALGKLSEGALLENSVYNSLRKYGRMNYYKKRTGAEIDFVLPEKKIALEVKSKGDETDYRRLKNAAARLSLRESYVITKAFVDGRGFVPATEV